MPEENLIIFEPLNLVMFRDVPSAPKVRISDNRDTVRDGLQRLGERYGWTPHVRVFLEEYYLGLAGREVAASEIASRFRGLLAEGVRRRDYGPAKATLLESFAPVLDMLVPVEEIAADAKNMMTLAERIAPAGGMRIRVG